MPIHLMPGAAATRTTAGLPLASVTASLSDVGLATVSRGVKEFSFLAGVLAVSRAAATVMSRLPGTVVRLAATTDTGTTALGLVTARVRRGSNLVSFAGCATTATRAAAATAGPTTRCHLLYYIEFLTLALENKKLHFFLQIFELYCHQAVKSIAHVSTKMKKSKANDHSKIAAIDFLLSQLSVNVPCTVAEQLYINIIIATNIIEEQMMNIILRKKLAILFLPTCLVTATATKLNTAHMMAANAKINVKTQWMLS